MLERLHLIYLENKKLVISGAVALMIVLLGIGSFAFIKTRKSKLAAERKMEKEPIGVVEGVVEEVKETKEVEEMPEEEKIEESMEEIKKTEEKAPEIPEGIEEPTEKIIAKEKPQTLSLNKSFKYKDLDITLEKVLLVDKYEDYKPREGKSALVVLLKIVNNTKKNRGIWAYKEAKLILENQKKMAPDYSTFTYPVFIGTEANPWLAFDVDSDTSIEKLGLEFKENEVKTTVSFIKEEEAIAHKKPQTISLNKSFKYKDLDVTIEKVLLVDKYEDYKPREGKSACMVVLKIVNSTEKEIGLWVHDEIKLILENQKKMKPSYSAVTYPTAAGTTDNSWIAFGVNPETSIENLKLQFGENGKVITFSP
ncbi:MAG: hypothetical protein J7M38_13580 [Armatimonadetes bacterium]|nr:hypothetical protein [Armatimonadota bacterium]